MIEKKNGQETLLRAHLSNTSASPETVPENFKYMKFLTPPGTGSGPAPRHALHVDMHHAFRTLHFHYPRISE